MASLVNWCPHSLDLGTCGEVFKTPRWLLSLNSEAIKSSALLGPRWSPTAPAKVPGLKMPLLIGLWASHKVGIQEPKTTCLLLPYVQKCWCQVRGNAHHDQPLRAAGFHQLWQGVLG